MQDYTNVARVSTLLLLGPTDGYWTHETVH